MSFFKVMIPAALGLAALSAGATMLVPSQGSNVGISLTSASRQNNGVVMIEQLKRIDKNRRTVVASGVQVTITLQQTGQTWEGVTDRHGNLTISGLPQTVNNRTAHYRVLASFNGGEAISRDGFWLSRNKTLAVVRMPSLRR